VSLSLWHCWSRAWFDFQDLRPENGVGGLCGRGPAQKTFPWRAGYYCQGVRLRNRLSNHVPSVANTVYGSTGSRCYEYDIVEKSPSTLSPLPHPSCPCSVMSGIVKGSTCPFLPAVWAVERSANSPMTPTAANRWERIPYPERQLSRKFTQGLADGTETSLPLVTKTRRPSGAPVAAR